MLAEWVVLIVPKSSRVRAATTPTRFRTMLPLRSIAITRRTLRPPAVILEAPLLSLVATQVRFLLPF
ncbi:unnamed protein product [Linum tenue]|uniref:Uncharacterized protein n=1 Tax=Linum tenue TaxID=586396 RepID=A0AAV0R619_9ROSI|nr:unnamed protein product [Linum tenue]